MIAIDVYLLGRNPSENVRHSHECICSIVWTFTSERQWGKESIPHHFCKMKPSQTAQKQQPINDLTVECLSDRSISFWGNRKYRSFGNNESVSFLPLDSLCANDHHPLPFCSSLFISQFDCKITWMMHFKHMSLCLRALLLLSFSLHISMYTKKMRDHQTKCAPTTNSRWA